MSRDRLCGRIALAVVIGLFAFSSAHAIISAALPLDALLVVSEDIAVARVEKVDPDRPAVVFTVQEDLKGKLPSRRMEVPFTGDADARKLDHVPQLLKRLAPGRPVVLFVKPQQKFYMAFAFTDGTWFQLDGPQTGDGGHIAWRLTHGEPNLRQTFHGTTAELRQLIVDGLARKRKMPAIDKEVAPGFGPEVPAKGSSRLWPLHPAGVGGARFAVIPTLGVGAPLVVLAALFPAVFGGVLLLFRQWIAFITVFSVNSTLLMLHWLLNSYWPGLLRGSWLGTDAGLWFVMTLVPLVALVWAWRRQLARQATLDAADAPPRTERTVLWSLTAVFVVVSVLTPLLSWYLADHYDPRGDLAWASLVVLTLGVVAGTVYRIVRGFGTAPAAPTVTTEGVMIAAILLGQVAYTAYRWGGGDDVAAAGPAVLAAADHAPAAGLHRPANVRQRWQYTPKNFNGVIVAAPLVDGGDLYAAAAGPTFKQGMLVCLDRVTGTPKWEFLGQGGDLKEMISGPVVAGGKLYMGEGFHDDPNCRLFCLGAADGALHWAFRTTGQTECSPCVAGGRVYFGAGNDGIYCVDAAGGKELWRFPPLPHTGRLLRCGATPTVAGKRVYAGSAVDRNARDDPGETSIFCLDADTGQVQWKKPTSLPAWAAPTVSDGQVIYALGNGDVFSDAEGAKPAGRVLCVDARTGDELWHFDAPNGVLDRPAVDGAHVYFGCRDGQVYAVGRHDGKRRWQAALGAPVVAAPALAACPGYAATAQVFAVAVNGTVVCLDPATGAALWSLPLTDKEAHFSAAPRVVAVRAEGGDRRLVYVAGGVGGLYTGRPVVYCLEDFVQVE